MILSNEESFRSKSFITFRRFCSKRRCQEQKSPRTITNTSYKLIKKFNVLGINICNQKYGSPDYLIRTKRLEGLELTQQIYRKVQTIVNSSVRHYTLNSSLYVTKNTVEANTVLQLRTCRLGPFVTLGKYQNVIKDTVHPICTRRTREKSCPERRVDTPHVNHVSDFDSRGNPSQSRLQYGKVCRVLTITTLYSPIFLVR